MTTHARIIKREIVAELDRLRKYPRGGLYGEIEITTKDLMVKWATGKRRQWLTIKATCPERHISFVEYTIHRLCINRFKEWGGSSWTNCYGHEVPNYQVIVKEKLLSIKECLALLNKNVFSPEADEGNE